MPRLRWMFVAALGALLFLVSAELYSVEIQKLARLRSAVAESSVELAEKERNVMEYMEKVAFYETDDGIAYLAREQYNLAFPGERVYIIKRGSSPNATEVVQP